MIAKDSFRLLPVNLSKKYRIRVRENYAATHSIFTVSLTASSYFFHTVPAFH